MRVEYPLNDLVMLSFESSHPALDQNCDYSDERIAVDRPTIGVSVIDRHRRIDRHGKRTDIVDDVDEIEKSIDGQRFDSEARRVGRVLVAADDGGFDRSHDPEI